MKRIILSLLIVVGLVVGGNGASFAQGSNPGHTDPPKSDGG